MPQRIAINGLDNARRVFRAVEAIERRNPALVPEFNRDEFIPGRIHIELIDDIAGTDDPDVPTSGRAHVLMGRDGEDALGKEETVDGILVLNRSTTSFIAGQRATAVEYENEELWTIQSPGGGGASFTVAVLMDRLPSAFPYRDATASITAASTTLTTTFRTVPTTLLHCPILIAGAGTAGAVHRTYITDIVGNTVTLLDAAVTTVADADFHVLAEARAGLVDVGVLERWDHIVTSGIPQAVKIMNHFQRLNLEDGTMVYLTSIGGVQSWIAADCSPGEFGLTEITDLEVTDATGSAPTFLEGETVTVTFTLNNFLDAAVTAAVTTGDLTSTAIVLGRGDSVEISATYTLTAGDETAGTVDLDVVVSADKDGTTVGSNTVTVTINA